MKKIFLHSLGIFFIVGNVVSAQQIRRCGTMENLAMLKQMDPSIEVQMQLIEEHTQRYIDKQLDEQKAGTIYSIPVVVHVVYNTSSQNISTTQIQSQIAVLNEDFRRLNADKSNTPSTFSGVAADAEISFCLATVDPNGNATGGIIRKSTTTTSFSDNDGVKYSSSGGSNAWPRDKYLNLWVCNLGGGLLGYAQFPGGPAATDGVVINYKYFGRNGSALAPYNKGRTATHEVGHWLNLRHIWGDAYCGNDYVSDSPVQQQDNYGCPSHPKSNSCGTSAEMFMNYMDYTDDGCMNVFSNGQKTRMRALFASGGARVALLSSNGCGTSSGGGTGTVSNSNTITIGSGTSVTSIAPYGTYYMDERVQFIVTKSELVSAGFTSANPYLKSLAFNVYSASSQTMNGFTIKVRHTTATSFGTSTNFLSASGMSTVFSGNVVAVTGWNTHNFSTGFAYNGNDNLLIDICWNNSSYTSDSKVYYTSKSTYNTLYKKADVSSGGVCANTTGNLSYNRPNMKMVFSTSAFKTNEEEESLTGMDEENISLPAGRSLAVYPNPAKDKLHVMFDVTENNSDAEILVYDILGDIVGRFRMENLQKGNQMLMLDFDSDQRFANVKSGIYLCSVNVNGKFSTEKFLITK